METIEVGSIVTLSRIELGHKDELPSAADTSVAKSIRERKSKCTACDSKKGGSCKSGCGKDKEPAGEEPQEAGVNTANIIIEVEFKGKRKGLYRNDKPVEVALGDLVIVEAERGLDAGRVSAVGRIAHRKMETTYSHKEPLFALVRKAAPRDEERYAENRQSEEEALKVYRERIAAFALDMKGVDAEWQFDRNRLTLYFTAPTQVDFRQLVRDLASIFSTRIELRQISPRDEAKRVGGVGICGRELCCTSFLTKFDYINLEHARVQQLAQNPTKLSGLCGRLKCCLLYEIDYYVSALKNYPPLNSRIRSKSGVGTIFKIDIFKDLVHLYIKENSAYETITLEELNKLRKAGQILLPDQENVEFEPLPEELRELEDKAEEVESRNEGRERRGRTRRNQDAPAGREHAAKAPKARGQGGKREERRRPAKGEGKPGANEGRTGEGRTGEDRTRPERRESAARNEEAPKAERKERRGRGGRGRRPRRRPGGGEQSGGPGNSER